MTAVSAVQITREGCFGLPGIPCLGLVVQAIANMIEHKQIGSMPDINT